MGSSDADLQQAAARVAASQASVGGSTDEVVTLLASLAAAVHQGRRGVALTLDRHAPSPLGRRLLESLRAELIRGWLDSGGDAETALILRTLSGVERVREALQPNTGESFVAQFAGPRGMDLLVEVAHDLRSPLTSILFLAETLQRGQSGTVNELQHRQLGLIYSAALGLSSLACDAIDLARNGNDLFDDGPTPFSLVALLDSVRDIVRPMAEEKGLLVRVVTQAPGYRLGNPIALGRVLLNLTTNAIKFTSQGFVEIRAEPRGQSLLDFAVRDTGRGIHPDALDNLYEPFRRNASQVGYSFSGTGLGLAICRNLVAAMGAELAVETRPDWGTRFHFSLEAPPAPDFAYASHEAPSL